MALRSLVHLVLIAILLSPLACAPSRKPAPHSTTVLASLVGSPPSAVEVQVENLPPTQHVERVFLVDRQGRKVTAAELENSQEPSAPQAPERPPVTFGVGFMSSLVIAVPRRKAEAPEGPRSVTAQIPLSDREAYLADPEAWTVVVEGWRRNGAPLRYRVPAPRLPESEGGIPAGERPPLPGRKP
ncbi:MAG: hypothetical protein QNJ30_22380 [Kiloniellales bacterium]|nr:hypothetical protein [Kiloniellales bacterium]